MKYYRVLFTNTYVDTMGDTHTIEGALSCEGYQEISDDMSSVGRFLDLNGNTLVIPEVQEMRITSKTPVEPNFAKPLIAADLSLKVL